MSRRVVTVYASMSDTTFEDLDLRSFCLSYLDMDHSLFSEEYTRESIGHYRHNIDDVIAKVRNLRDEIEAAPADDEEAVADPVHPEPESDKEVVADPVHSEAESD
ncbi:hypothetical protein Hanom_Chr08g00693141 [Helianthus anomalus]